jgi:hypothetical protein
MARQTDKITLGARQRNLMAGVTLVLATLALAACAQPDQPPAPPPPWDMAKAQEGDLPAYAINTANVFATYPAPDDWHALALYGNWDFVDPAAWRAIVMRPDCDQATALAIFWKLQPDYYAEFASVQDVPPVNRPGYDLLLLIRDRWRAGRYRRQELGFDPDRDVWPLDLPALYAHHGQRARDLMPEGMRVTLPGRMQIPERYDFPGVYSAP